MPSEPLAPILKLAVLPVAPTYVDTESGYQATYGMPVVVPTNPRPGGADVGTAIGVGLIMGTAAAIVGHESDKRRVELNKAVSSIGFHPADLLNRQLQVRLEQAGVKVVSEADADAILAVYVSEVGYSHSWRAGGYTPYLGIIARLTSSADNQELESLSYWSDWRESKHDRRWITAPASLTFTSFDDLKANADNARTGMEAMLDRIVSQLVQDVKRRADGLKPEK